MKTTKNLFRTAKIVLATAAVALPSIAGAQTVRINISNAQFARPLVEKLVGEYQKQNPSFKAEIITTDEAGDATVSITPYRQESVGTIANYVLLPITNSKNSLLNDKKVQKGLNDKLSHEIFVEKGIDEYDESKDSKQLPGTVYTLSGKHSTTTELLANTLNVDVKSIKGKKIIGREENVITVVKNRPDAIAVDVATLVYDKATHQPVSGVTILPIDLNGDNKVSDEERAAIASLDALNEYISNQRTTSLPTGSIRLSSQDKDADAFVIWASTTGQNYVSSLGYLKSTADVAQK